MANLLLATVNFEPCLSSLTLKASITTAADDILNIFSLFSDKIRLDVSSESSARQRIHSKHQALFSSGDKSKKLKCRLLQFLFSPLRVKMSTILSRSKTSHFKYPDKLKS